MIYKELVLKGSMAYNDEDFKETVELFSDGTFEETAFLFDYLTDADCVCFVMQAN